uniref:Uncharacterized protein n=1 Tax=Meloidogyne javanica TaxID=6303 RepID=A0A915N2V7_MELJA
MAKGNIQLINDKLIYCQINQSNLEIVKFGEALQLVGEVINFYFEKERFLPTKNDIPLLDEINELDEELTKEMKEIEQKINEEELGEIVYFKYYIFVARQIYKIYKNMKFRSDYGDFNPAPVLQKPEPGPIVDPGRK